MQRPITNYISTGESSFELCSLSCYSNIRSMSLHKITVMVMSIMMCLLNPMVIVDCTFQFYTFNSF